MNSDRFITTIGQLALTGAAEVLDQMRRTIRANPASELFVFPEYSAHSDDIGPWQLELGGSAPDKAEAVRTWLGSSVRESDVRSLAKDFGKAIVFGSLHHEQGKLSSRAIFFDPLGPDQHVYDKTHVHWTEGYLTPGNALEVFPTRFGRMAHLICYDTAFAEAARTLGLKGAEIICAIAATPRHFHWKYVHRRLQGAAITNQCFVIGAHLSFSAEVPMGGHSLIVGPNGDPLAESATDEADVISAVLDFATLRDWRAAELIDPARRPELYSALADRPPTAPTTTI